MGFRIIWFFGLLRKFVVHKLLISDEFIELKPQFKVKEHTTMTIYNEKLVSFNYLV